MRRVALTTVAHEQTRLNRVWYIHILCDFLVSIGSYFRTYWPRVQQWFVWVRVRQLSRIGLVGINPWSPRKLTDFLWGKLFEIKWVPIKYYFHGIVTQQESDHISNFNSYYFKCQGVHFTISIRGWLRLLLVALPGLFCLPFCMSHLLCLCCVESLFRCVKPGKGP